MEHDMLRERNRNRSNSVIFEDFQHILKMRMDAAK